MSCTYRDRNETILAYVRQELNAQTQEVFEEHYFACEECASDVLFYEKSLLVMQGQGGIVFARPKQRRVELLTTVQLFLNRLAGKLALQWGEGGAVRAFAGYALLIVFLSASSFGLYHASGFSSSHREVDAGVAPLGVTTPLNAPEIDHIAWKQDLILTQDPALQARLEAIRRAYENEKNYAAAGEGLAELLNANAPLDARARLFVAVCLIKQNRKEEATGQLETLSLDPAAPGHAQAQTLLQQIQKK